jgi:hypothetical protein
MDVNIPQKYLDDDYRSHYSLDHPQLLPYRLKRLQSLL